MTIIHGTVTLATNLAAAWWQPVAVVSLVLGRHWAWRRACRWADETLADVPWIVEEPLTLIRDDFDLWNDELDDLRRDDEAWARIQKAINIPRPRREGEIG